VYPVSSARTGRDIVILASDIARSLALTSNSPLRNLVNFVSMHFLDFELRHIKASSQNQDHSDRNTAFVLHTKTF
jgi:hypothetical protein